MTTQMGSEKSVGTANANPFLVKSNYLDQAFDYSQLKTEHFLEALHIEIEKSRALLQKVQASAPNYAQTVLSIETALLGVQNVHDFFYLLSIAHQTSDLESIADEMARIAADFQSEVFLNKDLYILLDRISQNQEELKTLNSEQLMLLKRLSLEFKRNGSALSDEKQNELRALDSKLAQLSLQFKTQVLKGKNAFKLVVTKSEDLAGIPPDAISAAKALAEKEGQPDAWIFTLSENSAFAVLRFSDLEDLRRRIWFAKGQACFDGGPFDTQNLIKEILNLRLKRAQLLGYDSFADYVLADRMAESQKNVNEFLQKIVSKALPKAKEELKELKSFKLRLTGDENLNPWDVSYFSEKLKKEVLDFDPETLRPYFSLNRVLKGVMDLSSILFDIEFSEVTEKVPTYHPDVRVYQVLDKASKNHKALLYLDLYARPEKSSGAWMCSYQPDGVVNGERITPQVGICCNFAKPTVEQGSQAKEIPSLLRLGDVETLFHEFGHALHGMLSKGVSRYLSGTAVLQDFVELPSQIMENWVVEKEGLNLFAYHYESGKPISEELIKKVKELKNFQTGMFTLTQLRYGLLDMAWYNKTEPFENLDIFHFEQKVLGEFSLFPAVEKTAMSPTFSHIFAGGYSAGYYSYMWAKVLDADAFFYFKDEGIFNKTVAAKFREHILETGGRAHPMELYKRFRGREPDPDAFLKISGLIN